MCIVVFRRQGQGSLVKEGLQIEWPSIYTLKGSDDKRKPLRGDSLKVNL